MFDNSKRKFGERLEGFLEEVEEVLLFFFLYYRSLIVLFFARNVDVISEP